MYSKKLFVMLPLLATCLCSCGETIHYDAKEYKAGEINFSYSTNKDAFNILQLTDIHMSDKDNQQIQFDFISLTINDAINKGVDMIVVDGDTFTFASKKTVQRVCQYIDSFNIPWTITFGNHDEQGIFSITWLTNYLNSFGSNCIFKDIQEDDVFGNANFYIDINESGSLFERIIILDSNRYYFNDYYGYDYLKQDQIDWYERISKDYLSTDAMMFFHIPLPEFETAYNLYKEGSSEITYLGGSNGEGISAPKYNSGLFKKIQELGNVKAIFVGHDHNNDSAIVYKNVLLSYGTNATDRIYYDEAMMGGQIISLKKDHSIELTRIHHSYKEVE